MATSSSSPATDLIVAPNLPSPSDLAPTTDRKLLKRYERFAAVNSISTPEDCTEAEEALSWLAERRKHIKQHPVMAKLIAQASELLNSLKAIIVQADAPYQALEPPLRAELTRYKTARERERQRIEREENARLEQQRRAKTPPPPVQEVTTKRGDTFVFERQAPAATAAAPMTLARPRPAAGGDRKYWRGRLVDPKKPFTKDGEPIPNAEAGFDALIKLVAAGKAPRSLLLLNESDLHKHADLYKERLHEMFPCLAAVCEVRPVSGSRR